MKAHTLWENLHSPTASYLYMKAHTLWENLHSLTASAYENTYIVHSSTLSSHLHFVLPSFFSWEIHALSLTDMFLTDLILTLENPYNSNCNSNSILILIFHINLISIFGNICAGQYRYISTVLYLYTINLFKMKLRWFEMVKFWKVQSAVSRNTSRETNCCVSWHCRIRVCLLLFFFLLFFVNKLWFCCWEVSSMMFLFLHLLGMLFDI